MGFDLNGMSKRQCNLPEWIVLRQVLLTAGAGGAGAPHTISCNYSGGVSCACRRQSFYCGRVGYTARQSRASQHRTYRGVADTYSG